VEGIVMSKALPSIYLTRADFGRLERLVSVDASGSSHVLRLLGTELERAVIVRPEEIAPDVVTMNSLIRYALSQGGQVTERVLVYPEDYTPTGQHVSVMSPLGAALLGLRAGTRMPFEDLSGAPLSVIVADVSFQPQRHHRETAPPPSRTDASIIPLVQKPMPQPSANGNGPGPDEAA